MVCGSWHNLLTDKWTEGPLLKIQWDEFVTDNFLDEVQVGIGWDGSEPQTDVWFAIVDDITPHGEKVESYMTKLRESETLYFRVVHLDADATFRLSGLSKTLESFENECPLNVQE